MRLLIVAVSHHWERCDGKEHLTVGSGRKYDQSENATDTSPMASRDLRNQNMTRHIDLTEDRSIE
ncbi:hypothetical protein [Burkholderia ambifaria]|uniref:Uncharacterized protein n=1 Tax=Burkholderia ambifaria MEX-5 TaxID=396597 RepID=B1T0R1_9BURK|nr:hypothetical protein [Burkholderia ambifaria]EDT42886.1 hypothetical protein BamMEX5DRAFT_1377 [Burkholderia ambifaria MEX-5]